MHSPHKGLIGHCLLGVSLLGVSKEEASPGFHIGTSQKIRKVSGNRVEVGDFPRRAPTSMGISIRLEKIIVRA
jgi:hypothetical protein